MEMADVVCENGFFPPGSLAFPICQGLPWAWSWSAQTRPGSCSRRRSAAAGGAGRVEACLFLGRPPWAL